MPRNRHLSTLAWRALTLAKRILTWAWTWREMTRCDSGAPASPLFRHRLYQPPDSRRSEQRRPVDHWQRPCPSPRWDAGTATKATRRCYPPASWSSSTTNSTWKDEMKTTAENGFRHAPPWGFHLRKVKTPRLCISCIDSCLRKIVLALIELQ